MGWSFAAAARAHPRPPPTGTLLVAPPAPLSSSSRIARASKTPLSVRRAARSLLRPSPPCPSPPPPAPVPRPPSAPPAPRDCLPPVRLAAPAPTASAHSTQSRARDGGGGSSCPPHSTDGCTPRPAPDRSPWPQRKIAIPRRVIPIPTSSGASSSGVQTGVGGKAGSAGTSKGAASRAVGGVKRPAEAGCKGGNGKRAKK